MHLKTSTLLIISLLVAIIWTSMGTVAQTPNPIWQAQYFDNTILAGPAAVTRQDSDIAFDWGYGSPASGIGENDFSVRWSTDVFLEAGTYRFWAYADDNIIVTVDFHNKIIDTFKSDQVDQLLNADIRLEAGTHHIQVDYREINSQAFAFVDFANLAMNPVGPDFPLPVNLSTSGAWTAQYFNNPYLVGTPVAIQSESQPGGNWGGGSPLPSIPVDYWSARWTAVLNLGAGNYRIRTAADDGVRVFVDSLPVIDEWHIAMNEDYTTTRNLGTGNHTVTVEFYEATGLAFLDFTLEPLNEPMATTMATITAGWLNVRATPEITGEILTQVTYGEVYPVLARTAENNWVKINANGVIGWVSVAYVIVPNLLILPIESNAPQVTGYIVTATPFPVNIRTGPGTQFKDIGNLPAESTAQVIGRNTNATWWQINYNDIVGWVSAQYAVIQSDADLTRIPTTD